MVMVQWHHDGGKGNQELFLVVMAGSRPKQGEQIIRCGEGAASSGHKYGNEELAVVALFKKVAT